MNQAEKRQALYEWRKANPEKYREIQKRAMEKYTEKHRQEMNNNQANYYLKHKEEILKKRKELRERRKNNGK